MAKSETVYGINVLMTADETMIPATKVAILELLDKGVQSRDTFLTTADAAIYCGMSRSSFYRHIRPLCKPIRVGFRSVRYSIINLDAVMKQEIGMENDDDNGQ